MNPARKIRRRGQAGIGEAPLNTIEQESFECPRMARRTNQRTDLVPLFEQRPYEIRSELPRRTENENTHSHSALNDASNLYASQHGPNRRHEPILTLSSGPATASRSYITPLRIIPRTRFP